MTNTTTTTTKRITKAMRFADIKALLNGETPTHGTDLEAALSFIDNEVALLAKKNTSDSKKPTKTQEENAVHKEKILAFLAGQPDGATCTTILKSDAEFMEFSNQKIAALCRQLVEDGRVVKKMDKGRAMFSLA